MMSVRISPIRKFYIHIHLGRVGFIQFVVVNATFNNISAISWRSVLLEEETAVPGENHRPAV
jgi:hypothetical protein